MKKNKYTDFIHCRTPEEVRAKVREWSSSLSDQDHLIRSTILDIHANIEHRLKQILYHHMSPLILQGDNKQKNTKRRIALERTIDRMSFMNIYRLLKPCLDAFSSSELSCIRDINEVRNQVAHGDIEKVSYKGGNPFIDHDCLAQLFVES
jgi:hypothetical protein